MVTPPNSLVLQNLFPVFFFWFCSYASFDIPTWTVRSRLNFEANLMTFIMKILQIC
jgi:hypothetical protein